MPFVEPGNVSAFAGQSDVEIYNRPIIDIYDAHEKKESLFTGDKSIFDICFPKLIGTGDFAIISQFSGMLDMYSSLWA